MANIRVTPEELEAQGNQLVSLADSEITQILGTVETQITAICDAWDGAAQDAFLQSYEQMKDTLKAFPEIVKGFGQQAVAAAKAFGEVDSTLSAGFKS